VMIPMQHYERAEELLSEGEKVVAAIRELALKRVSITASKPNGELGALGPHDEARVAALTREMDEKGKKVMGIWAQAQVHATLATR
jgi:hypothetical protein